MTRNPISRRKFLKTVGLTLAAATLTCSGLGYAATRQPDSDSVDITFTKDSPMKQRILVTYATRAGSTAEIAERIGETLSERGYDVDVRPVKAKPDLEGYQAVILGSPIRMGSWLSEAVDYIKSNQAKLASLPVAIFTVHMLNTGEDEESRNARATYTSAIDGLLTPVDKAYFTGKMELARLSFLDRTISKMMKAVDEDLRDWESIQSWAQNVLEAV